MIARVLFALSLASCLPAHATPDAAAMPPRVDVDFQCSFTMKHTPSRAFPVPGEPGSLALPCHYRLIARTCEVSGTTEQVVKRCRVEDLGTFKVSPGEVHRVTGLPAGYQVCTSPLAPPTLAECAAQLPR